MLYCSSSKGLWLPCKAPVLMPVPGRQGTMKPEMNWYSSTKWSSWQARLAIFVGALILFGVVDMHVYLPRLKIHRGDDSLTVKHMGWERMSLDPIGVRGHFQGMMTVPGNKLQPVDVLKGSRDASLHQDEVRPSPYRSEGAMKPYTGDLARMGTLQQALEARSHKKEVILVHFRDREIGMALNMVLNLRKLTFEHFILLTLDEISCQNVLKAFPKAGCVWSTYLGNGELEFFGKGTADHHNAHERLILIRYHTIARMIRAGYNVLSVHADSHFSDDPYVYVKHPPLSKASLVTMSHGGWAGLTTGFLYIQNANVAGPVSWIFTEAVARILRYAEDPEFLEVEGSSKTLGWAIGDEDILRDAVASAYLGRPVAWHSLWSEGKDNRAYSRAGQNLNDVWQAHADLAIKKKVRIENWVDSLGEDIHSRLGITGGYFEHFNLTIPKEPPKWDAKLGGDPFPAKRGQVSLQWTKASSKEVSGLTGDSWDEKTSEVLIQPLMYGKFMEYGHNGLVNGAFYLKPRPFFFAHVIGIRAYMQGRSILMKAVGMWHWEATEKLEALQREHKGKALFPTLSDKRVLSFAPDVLPLHFDDEADFRAAVMGLVQLAIASKRTPVWPDVACNSLWLDDEKAAAQRGRSGQPKKWMAEDWRGDIEIVPRLPLDGPPSTHRCLVWYYYEEACDMQGLSLMNFFHLRDQIWPAHVGDPRENNTLMLEGVKELRTEADAAWLKKEMDSMSKEPVVYLGKTMRVKTLGTESEAERRLEALQEACLDRAFHISMDRVNYRASDRGQVQEEQEEVLQELKDLKNPEAAAGEKAAAVEAAKLLQKAREEPKEEGTPEDSKAKHVEEKRLTMQAMHVPHEEAGKGSTSGQILGGAQILGSQQSLGTRPSAQAPVHGLDERTAAEQDLSLEASKEVGVSAEDEGAQEEDEDPEVEQIEKEVAAEKERERALKQREEAVARVAKEEQEKAEQAEEARQRELQEEKQREKEREVELARQRIKEQEDLDLASVGGNLLGTEELGFHDIPDSLELLPDKTLQPDETIKEGELGQTDDIPGQDAEISVDDEREARYASMGENSRAADEQQAERAEKSQLRRRRELLDLDSHLGGSASVLRDGAAAMGKSSSRSRWASWPWQASREELSAEVTPMNVGSNIVGPDVKKQEVPPPIQKHSPQTLASTACDWIGLITERSAKLLKIG